MRHSNLHTDVHRPTASAHVEGMRNPLETCAMLLQSIHAAAAFDLSGQLIRPSTRHRARRAKSATMSDPAFLPADEIGWGEPFLVDFFTRAPADIFNSARPLGLSYWDLHGGLLIPTVWLLTAGSPSLLRDKDASSLTRDASFSFLAFILAIAVAQAFVWDSVGAAIGIWEFNPEKTTGLGDSTLLPLEEIMWLFHHVVKAALWQLKMKDFTWSQPTGEPEQLSPEVRTAVNSALLLLTFGGIYFLQSGYDGAKCIALVSAFFAPVLAIIFNIGSRYFKSHWPLFLAGWAPPGWWTVIIDCVGQQQGVWNFPSTYLTGVNSVGGLLKLDIALVYLVSTFAVTGTGAIILAACDELNAEWKERRVSSDSDVALGAVPAGVATAAVAREPNLVDLAIFLYEKAFPGWILPDRILSASGINIMSGLRAPESPESVETAESVDAEPAEISSVDKVQSKDSL